MSDINDTLKQRGKIYGEFHVHAEISQKLKNVMHRCDNWNLLPPYMKEALEMTAHKIARILNGDPLYADSWHDIIGYIKLVENRVAEYEENKDETVSTTNAKKKT